jgi:hypothetical protein
VERVAAAERAAGNGSCELADTVADLIRGFDTVKLAGIGRATERADQLLAELGAAGPARWIDGGATV